MADTTWSVRMDDETKAEVVTLLNSSGEQAKEFIQSLMAAYKLKKAEELQPAAAQDIKDLQIHLGRIQDIYYNLSQRIDTRIKAKDDEVRESLTKKDSELMESTAKIAELAEEVHVLTDMLTGCNNVIDNNTKKIAELEEANGTTKALVAEYKDKNDTLTGLLAEYKAAKAELDIVKAKLHDESEAREAAEKEKTEMSERMTRQEEQHAEDADRMKIQHAEDIDRIQEKNEEDSLKLSRQHKEETDKLTDQHADDLNRVKNNLVMEHKQFVLDLQAKHQEEVNRLHQTYNDQIQELIVAYGLGKNNQ